MLPKRQGLVAFVLDYIHLFFRTKYGCDSGGTANTAANLGITMRHTFYKHYRQMSI